MKLNRTILLIAGALVASVLWMTASVNVRAQTNESTDEDAAAPALPIPLPAVTDAASEAPAPPAEQPAPQPSVPPSPVAQPAPPPHPVTVPTPVAAPPSAAPKPTFPIEFNNAPAAAVLEYYARMTNRSIISAPNVLSVPPITFRSQTELTKEEAIQALDSVLAINGIGTVPMGDRFLKVVTIGTAKQEGPPVGVPLPPGDTLVTQVLPLKYADVAEVAAALQPYMHSYGQLIQLAKSNSILITETGANIGQMLEILKYVDQPSPLRVQTKVYVLSHAKASEVVSRLNEIIQQTQQLGARASGPGQPTPTPAPTPAGQPRRPTAAGAAATGAAGTEESVVEGKVIITSDERTNKIFLLSRPSNFDFFDRVIAELDAKVDPDVVIKVIALQYATAEDAGSLINALITGGSAPTATRRTTSSTGTSTYGQGRPQTTIPPPPAGSLGGAGAVDTGFLQFAQGVRILPDYRTNSLLLMATKGDMLRLEQLIQSIDTAVAQVLIEVVIAEVDLKNELDVGVDFFKQLFDGSHITQAGGTGNGDTVPGTILTAAELAGSGGLTYFATFQNLKLDAVIHALATTSKSKVLSTPVIQTMDNQEASIVVGSSVPVPVSSVSSVVGAVGTNATGQFNTNIEYKDVAIELKVTPRINPDGYVRMDIVQKVNDLGAGVPVSGTTAPIINKREATSSVAVQDGSTIVLGGLIKENKTVTENKVPILGDIPLLSTLFKSKKNGKERTELIIFIRPTVLRTDAQAVGEARRRSRMLKAGEELELEKRFQSSEPGATDTKLNEEKKVKNRETSVAESNNRHAAKVKALQEEESEGQPVAPSAQQVN